MKASFASCPGQLGFHGAWWRVVAVGAPHHITQRSNNRQDVFLFDEDRGRYLDALRAQCPRHDVTLLGWCSIGSALYAAGRGS